MLSGFNTNFRYRGILFHVQTEDSGRQHPHVITHLFHGGNILASEKRDYKALLNAADLEAEVRALMEGQHKAMLKKLSRGEHDELIKQRLGQDAFEEAPADNAGDTIPPVPPAPAAGGEPAAHTAPDPAAEKPAGRGFGKRSGSEKPLDEVVLDYLVENARKRKRSAK